MNDQLPVYQQNYKEKSLQQDPIHTKAHYYSTNIPAEKERNEG